MAKVIFDTCISLIGRLMSEYREILMSNMPIGECDSPFYEPSDMKSVVCRLTPTYKLITNIIIAIYYWVMSLNVSLRSLMQMAHVQDIRLRFSSDKIQI